MLLAALPAAAQTAVPQSRAEIGLGFVPVVRKATPAVVNIYARRIVEERVSPFAGDPLFQNLFRDFGVPRARVQNSLGSGVIVDGGGLVVSNNHVVGGADDIRVVLNDRREFSARLLLADAETDLAVLQIEGADALPALALRDSDTVAVGELVLAIGNPFGVGQTVSSGIVSGLARSGTAAGTGRGYFIQTDAPINPGNSGGALVDVNGDLIGINTAILSRSGGSNGIGFAIPAALVAQFVKQAQAGNDSFRRPWAGMRGQAVTVDMAEGLGMSRPEGLIVTALHPESPFVDAGLRRGDVITALDGRSVRSMAGLAFRMALAGIGAEVTVTRLRDGATAQLPVVLRAAPDTPPRGRMRTGRRAAIAGMTLSDLSPRVIDKLDLPLTASGAVVEDPGPAGARAGLKAGDVLMAINGRRVDGAADARRLLRRVGDRLALQVLRGDRRLLLRFRL